LYRYTEEVINRNCRFLQGPGTDPEIVKKMAACIVDGEEFAVRHPNTPFPPSPHPTRPGQSVCEIHHHFFLRDGEVRLSCLRPP
jgi:hypothetical protein